MRNGILVLPYWNENKNNHFITTINFYFMEKIKKNGLERVINRHNMECSKFQSIVTNMLEVGFEFTTDELKDLAFGCTKLYKQAEKMANKEASRSKIKFKRDADYAETLKYLNDVIFENSETLKKALLWHTHSPLDIEAYEVIDGIVQMSSYWIEKKDMEYTILPTDRRKQAHQLVNNVRKAIEELNFFVSDNRSFGKGLSSWDDDRRCLCWIDCDGNFHEEKENYEFI